MKRLFITILIVLSLTSVIACSNNTKEYIIEDEKLESTMIDDNYRVYYEIFVGAFSDSNDDEMGDIQGIINRLDYLNDGDLDSGKSLGVTGIWLMPIMPSPSYHKYDTINYKGIDPDFGTMEDFENLIQASDERHIDIIIDLVINHTSNYHPWFRQAKEAAEENDINNPYLEYYTLVTEEEMVEGRTYHHFHGDLYYECNFWSGMPELNLDSQLVRDEIKSILEFWIGKGVKGFRLDAVKYPYFENHDKNIEFWNWFMTEVKNLDEDAYVVGEMWDSNRNIYPYYEPFNNFDFGMAELNGYVSLTVKNIETVNAYVTYLKNYKDAVKDVNPDAILQPFISNHDMNRAAGYLPVDDYKMHMAANLYILTYGTPFIYYGEEIGMLGSRGTENTDANRRLAMFWGDGDTVTNPIGATWSEDRQTNGSVMDQIDEPDSLYNHYKKLIMLRHANPEIARGNYTVINFDGYSAFGGFLTTYENSTVGVFHNTSSSEVVIDLSDYTDYSFSEMRGYVGQSNATLSNQVLTIGPLTSVILK
ncbi:MAG: alpha-amylase family glycosyl hydrolase [Candidatus Izemoplasmatales bacterium]